MRRSVILLVAAALLLPAVGVAAGEGGARVSPVLGSDFRISTNTEWEERPAVAWNATDGEYLVVWSDFRAPSGLSDIYGRRVRPDGAPIDTADFRISGPAATSDETYPAVAWNATADQYLVVWIDWRSGSYADIYGRRLKADGTPLGADFRISVSAPKDEGIPDVVWNALNNQYLVVWSDTRFGDYYAPRIEIYGQRVRGNGSLVGAEIHVSGAGATGNDTYAAVAWNAVRNQYLVVWQDNRSVLSSHIYGRRFNASGAPVGEDFPISRDAGSYSENDPDVAWSGTTNQYLVVWEDYRDPLHLSDLYGRRVRATGSLVGDADVRLSGPNATSNEIRPAIAWSETSGQFLLVWQDQRAGAERDWDIYGRKVRSSGLPTGADFRICGTAAVDVDRAPAVAWNDADNQYLVVWEDGRNPAGSIYGRLAAG